MDSSDKHRLSNRELGEFLQLLGSKLGKESGVAVEEITSFIEEVRMMKGLPVYPHREYVRDTSLDKTEDFVNSFATAEELRVLLQTIYGVNVPYRLSRFVLLKLGIGTILTSQIDLETAKIRWKDRQSKISSLDIFEMPRKLLIEVLDDDELFPDGYAISSFAKRFGIRLPRMKQKEQLIDLLLKTVFERPRDSRKIGRWGLDRRKGPE